MCEVLYKVSAPREDLTFTPSPFWRTEDWSSSSTRPGGEGYIEDLVLYAAGFDEVNIHLLPKIWRLRVWLDARNAGILGTLGHRWKEGSRALIFFDEKDRTTVESFRPTIFTFARDGFEPIPSNEFIAHEPRTALGSETLTMDEAIARWHIEVRSVSDRDALVETLERAHVPFSIQT